VNDFLSRWRQPHDFRHVHEGRAEKRLWWVIAITLVTMLAELIGGYAFGSMALVADGWHMGSHAAALSISACGYFAARYFTGHARFTFGTGKIAPLAGYSSALLLGGVALLMGAQSLERLVYPVPVQFDQALGIAVIGLVVNLACAWLLRDRPHAHTHEHEDHGHAGHRHGARTQAAHHHDTNLAAAYLHVLADALTSVLAIAALAGGKLYGWVALDAAMGLVGAVVITHWAIELVRRSARVLLDAEDTGPLVDRVRDLLEDHPHTHVADLHVWRVGMNAYACIATVVTRGHASVELFKDKLAQVPEIRHVTVEVNRADSA
jgi:cation diffusion facilitator family transporter